MAAVEPSIEETSPQQLPTNEPTSDSESDSESEDEASASAPEEVVVAKPIGRINKQAHKTEELAAEETRQQLKTLLIGSIVAAIVVIDDEWIWIPGVLYGVAYYYYKRFLHLIEEMQKVSPVHMLCGSAAGISGTFGMSLLMTAVSPVVGSSLAELSRSAAFSPGGVTSNFMWGLRLGVFTKLFRDGVEHTPSDEITATTKASHAAYAAGVAEAAARVVFAPVTKVIDQHRKTPEASLGKVIGEMRKKGLISFWEGMAPIRIEVPHMALMIGTWATLRGQINQYLPKWDESTVTTRIASRLPVDMFCGAVGAGVAYTATHQWRINYEEKRASEVIFSQSSKKAVCPLVVNHSKIPLKECLTFRTPQAALVFGTYGLAMSLAEPTLEDAGLVGWGDFDQDLETEYGGRPKHLAQDRHSFWEFFGVKGSKVPKYNTPTPKTKSNDEE